MAGSDNHPIRRMRVTLPVKLANDLLIPVLSPVCRIQETFTPSMIITMDYTTFGMFMAAVAQLEPAIPLKSLNIEYVDLRKEPTRITVRQGTVYASDTEV